MIEALCTTSRTLYDVDNHGERWRKESLAAVLPALLLRTTDPALRRRVLEQSDNEQLAALADQGVVTVADLPVILDTHRPTPGLIIGTLLHPHVGRLDLQCDVVLSPSTGNRLFLYRPQPGTDAAERLEFLRVLGHQTFTT
ncbi:hypothetical protein [Streptomyces sp. NPDC001678]|uniref:MmyB family transcriptional regulator n=1 Tax=Streptomyces sp. NPDC001678 TaxID=3364599 RepID=UPI0036D182B6